MVFNPENRVNMAKSLKGDVMCVLRGYGIVPALTHAAGMLNTLYTLKNNMVIALATQKEKEICYSIVFLIGVISRRFDALKRMKKRYDKEQNYNSPVSWVEGV